MWYYLVKVIRLQRSGSSLTVLVVHGKVNIKLYFITEIQEEETTIQRQPQFK